MNKAAVEQDFANWLGSRGEPADEVQAQLASLAYINNAVRPTSPYCDPLYRVVKVAELDFMQRYLETNFSFKVRNCISGMRHTKTLDKYREFIGECQAAVGAKQKSSQEDDEFSPAADAGLGPAPDVAAPPVAESAAAAIELSPPERDPVMDTAGYQYWQAIFPEARYHEFILALLQSRIDSLGRLCNENMVKFLDKHSNLTGFQQFALLQDIADRLAGLTTDRVGGDLPAAPAAAPQHAPADEPQAAIPALAPEVSGPPAAIEPPEPSEPPEPFEAPETAESPATPGETALAKAEAAGSAGDCVPGAKVRHRELGWGSVVDVLPPFFRVQFDSGPALQKFFYLDEVPELFPEVLPPAKITAPAGEIAAPSQ